MTLNELLKNNLIVKIEENKYLCKNCNNIYSKFGISNHYFYEHEIEGKEKKEKLRQFAINNNNTIEMKKKISRRTKEAFKKEEVQKNFNRYVKRIKVERIGEGNPMYGKTHSEEWRKNKSEEMKNFKHTEETKQLLKEINTGKYHTKESISKMRLAKLGKKDNTETKLKKSISQMGRKAWNKLTISKINKKCPFFSQIEDLRYNPEKPGEKEIQVHCKYNKCPNSKENGGWFTPTREQFKSRKGCLENEGEDKSYFYCSNECKKNCKLFNLRNDPYKETESSYIPDYETFRQEVLRRQREEYGYNFCEYCESEENLHVHHEKPQKTNLLFVLDPDNGVVLCKECHYIIGHQDGCSTGNLSKKECI